MSIQLLSTYTGLSESSVKELLSLNRAQIYQDDLYKDLVEAINQDELRGSLVDARGIYDQHLPELVEYLRDQHNYAGNPMTAATLGNWVLGFLHNPEHLDKMWDFHKRVPNTMFRAGFPHVLHMLDEMGSKGHEWKKAIAILSMPFFCEG